MKQSDSDIKSLNFQRAHGEEDPDYHFSAKKITMDQNLGVDKKYKTMKVMECVYTLEKNWFVGFSLQRERMYLIERLEYDNYSVFRWIASVESLAK